MTLPAHLQGSRRLAALTELLIITLKPVDAQELDQGLYALRTRLSSESERRRYILWSRAAIAALFVLAVEGVVLFLRHQRSSTPERTLAVERIEGGKLLDGGYVSAFGDADVKLFFDEGSAFVLARGTRGRLRSVDAEGAHLAIDQGTAACRITENPQHRWVIEAGPFLVTVKGTEFTVFWDASSERFEVRLKRGRVSVRGPVLDDELVLGPGRRLSVDLPRAELVVTEGAW